MKRFESKDELGRPTGVVQIHIFGTTRGKIALEFGGSAATAIVTVASGTVAPSASISVERLDAHRFITEMRAALAEWERSLGGMH